MTAEFSRDVRAAALRRATIHAPHCVVVCCEICGSPVGEDLLQLHHRRPRGMGSTTQPESAAVTNCLAICPSCHRMVESYRHVALMCGWLVSNFTDPVDAAVLYCGVWCWLKPDAAVEEVISIKQ
jgi:5-methylcytosine-specific restriction enzyme A